MIYQQKISFNLEEQNTPILIAINVETVKNAVANILVENESFFFQYRQLLTPDQWNFLIAVAKENGSKDRSSYQIYDVFFSRWLEVKY
jgi:hypothetical protein